MNFLSEDSNYSTFILSTLSIFNVVFFFSLSFTATYFQPKLTPISIELSSFSPSVSMDTHYTIEMGSSSEVVYDIGAKAE
jgi:hypothetical protein